MKEDNQGDYNGKTRREKERVEEGEARNKSWLVQKARENNWKAEEIKKREGRVNINRGEPIATNKSFLINPIEIHNTLGKSIHSILHIQMFI